MKTNAYLHEEKLKGTEYVDLYYIESGMKYTPEEEEYEDYEAYGEKGLWDHVRHVCGLVDMPEIMEFFLNNTNEYSYVYVFKLPSVGIEDAVILSDSNELNILAAEAKLTQEDIVLKVLGEDKPEEDWLKNIA